MNAGDYMAEGFAAIAKAGGQAVLLGAIVLLVQYGFRKKLPATWRYVLWVPVVFRLLFPVLPESAWSIYNFLPEHSGREFSGPQTLEVVYVPADSELIAPLADNNSSESFAARSFSWLGLLASLSLGGAIFFGFAFTLGSWRLGQKLRCSGREASTEAKELLEEVRSAFGVKQRVKLIESEEVDSPALFGLMRPKLLLPPGLLERLSVREQRHVFAHECAHLKRGDLWSNALLVFLQAVHWWNPVVWFFFGRIRADRELACDHLALSYLNEGEAAEYGQTLLRLLEGFGGRQRTPALVGILEEKNQLKERVRQIAGFTPGRRMSWLAVGLLAALVVTGLSDARKNDIGDQESESPTPKSEAEIRTQELVEAAKAREGGNSNQTPEIASEKPQEGPDYQLRIERPMDARVEHALRTYRLESVSFDGETLDQAVNKLDEQIRRKTGITNEGLFRFQRMVRLVDKPGDDNAEVQREEDRGAVFSVNAVGYIYENVGTGTFAEKVNVKTGDLGGMTVVEALGKIVAGANPAQPRIGIFVDKGYVFFQAESGRSARERINQDNATLNEAAKLIELRRFGEARRALDSLRDADEAFAILVKKSLAEKEETGQIPIAKGEVEDARLLMELGNFNEAEEKLREVLKKDPRNRSASYYLAVLREKRAAQEAASKAVFGPIKKPIPIEVKETGKYVCGGETVSLEQLEQALIQRLKEDPASWVAIRAENQAPYGGVVAVLDLCEKLKITNVNVLSKPAAKKADVEDVMTIEVSTAGKYLIEGKEYSLEQVQAEINTRVQENPRLTVSPKGDEGAPKEKVSELIDLLEGKHLPGLRPESKQSKPSPQASKPPRGLIRERLESIVVPEFGIPEERKLSEVVLELDRLSKATRLGEGNNINFLITSIVGMRTVEPTTRAQRQEQVLVDDFLVKIAPPLRNVNLSQVVEAVARTARAPAGIFPRRIGVTIEDYGVVFAAQPGPEEEPLYTRTFKLDPNLFLEAINKGHSPTPPESGEVLQGKVRGFFKAEGVDFSPAEGKGISSASTNPPPQKAVFFNDRTGVLFVRATLAELDKMERVLQRVMTTPPLVKFQTRVVEIWGHAPEMRGFFTEEQHAALMKIVGEDKQTKMEEMPSVTTLSGRPARTSVEEGDKPITVVDLLANVAADGFTIELTVTARDENGKELVTSSGTLFDGQTLAFGLPAEGRKDRIKMIFVTPRIIDPAGNIVYTGENRPYDPKKLPAQK